MKIFDPEFQPNWCLDKRIKLVEPEILEKICVPTTYGNIYITEDELVKYSEETDNIEEQRDVTATCEMQKSGPWVL